MLAAELLSIPDQNAIQLPFRRTLLFWLVLTDSWCVFQYYLLAFPGAWLFPYVLGALLFLFLCLSQNRRVFFNICMNTKVFLFEIWILYTVINSYYKNFTGSSVTVSFAYLAFFLPLQVYIFRTDFAACLKCTAAALTFVISFFLMASAESIMTLTRISSQYVNANDLAQYVNILLFAAGIMLFSGIIRRFSFFFFSVFCIIVSLLCQSRTGLVGLLFLFLSCMFLFAKNLKRVLFNSLSGCLLAYLAYELFFVNTEFFDRFRSIETESIMSQYDNWLSVLIEKFAGERSYYYFKGWEIFEYNFWTGIGAENFQWHPINTIGTVCHVELMSQLCEGGLIGAGLFLCAQVSLSFICFKRFLQSKHAADFAIFLFCSFPLLECLSAHIFPATRYLIIFAFIIFYLDYFKQDRIEGDSCSSTERM